MNTKTSCNLKLNGSALVESDYSIYGFHVEIPYRHCKIVSHPSTGLAYFAIPNCFYHDIYNGWISPFFNNSIFVDKFPEIAKLPFESFELLPYRYGMEDEGSEPLFSLTIPPDSSILINNGLTNFLYQTQTNNVVSHIDNLKTTIFYEVETNKPSRCLSSTVFNNLALP